MTASSHSSAGSERPAGSAGSFTRARLASFLAVLPLGVWSFIHVWNNLAAFRAEGDHGAAWQAAVTEYPNPVAQLVTSIVVLLPLVLHTIWGIGRLLTARPNNARYRGYANFKYVLQRLSAVGVFLFLGAHLWLAMLQPRLASPTGHAELFADISHEMRFHTPTLVVYVLGTLGVAYHLANGLQTFAMGWGLVSSKRAVKRVEWVSMLVFVAFLGMSWAAIYAIYTNAPPA